MNKKWVFILLILAILFFIKFSLYYSNIDRYDGDNNSSFKNSKKLLGYDVTLTNNDRQYPPLYSIMLIPAIIFNLDCLFIVIGIFFSVLTFIPLFYISKKYVSIKFSIILSSGIVLFSSVFNNDLLLGKTAISVFLVSCLLFFFLDYNKNKFKKFILSSIIFMFLICNEYVFFFMIPFITLFLYYQYRNSKIPIIVLFFIPSITMFLFILISNMVNYGTSLHDVFGGYQGIFTIKNVNPFLEIYPKMIISKLVSTFTDLNVIMVLYHYYIFFIVLISIHLNKEKLLKYFKKEDMFFYKLLVFNFVIFFCLPCMMWNRDYLIYRYLSYFAPVYLLLSVCILKTILRFKKLENKKLDEEQKVIEHIKALEL